MVQQELLQHLPRREQEIRIAPLAMELERVLAYVSDRDCVGGRCTGTVGGARRRCFNVRGDDHLELALDALNKSYEVSGRADFRKISTGRDSHVCFEGDVFLL